MKKILSIMFAIATILSAAGVSAAAESRTFADIPEDAWYTQYVADCAEKGLMIGNPDNEFEPESPVTRAQFVQTLYTIYQKRIKATNLEYNSHYFSTHESCRTVTYVDATYPFTIQRKFTKYDPNDSTYTEKIVSSVTRDELLSGNIPDAMYIDDVSQDENHVIRFESDDEQVLIPDSSDVPCMISMEGGCGYVSGFEGCAERVTAYTDQAKIEAKTNDGADFRITLNEIRTRITVIISGVSSGEVSAEIINGYDLTVKGAKGMYTVEIYKGGWSISGGLLKSFSRSAQAERSSVLPFQDINENAYYIEALNWAARNDFAAGVSNNEFAPNAPITREQMATVLIRYYIDYDLFLYRVHYDEDLVFTDAAEVSEYAKRYVDFACKSGLLAGDENCRFNPKAFMKRCELTVVLTNLYDLIPQMEKIIY